MRSVLRRKLHLYPATRFTMFRAEFCLLFVAVAMLGALLAARNPLSGPVRLDPVDPTLRYVFAFHRHGIRSPISPPYPRDPNIPLYPHVFPDGLGKLTKIGKKGMYHVGKSLRKRYGSFVEEYRENKVRVTSTPITRTIMSALSAMAGMFPPYTPILEDLEWQPIPVWHNTTDMDKTYVAPDGDFARIDPQFCPTFVAFIRKVYQAMATAEQTPQSNFLFGLLQEHTGAVVNSQPTAAKLFDTLHLEKLNDMPLPTWTTQLRSELNNQCIYPDLIRPNFAKPFIGLDMSDQIMHLFSGPMLNTVQQQFQKKASKMDSPEKLWYHSTHDIALFVVLWTLKVKEITAFEPGDGIIFELHEEEAILIVKILYFRANEHAARELVSPLCPSPCTLADFTSRIPGLTPQHWQDKCNS